MKAKKEGFTLIEIAVTLAILVIGATLAIGILFRSLPRMRIRGDAWDIHQALLNAKMTAVAEKVNVGVMFVYRGTGGNPICAQQDCYFIFKDSDGNNQLTDLDGNIFHQCEFVNPAINCTVADEDLIIGQIKKLHLANTLFQIFGVNMSAPGHIAWIIFSPLGNAEWFGTYANPNPLSFNGGDIQIRTRQPVDKATNRYFVGGVAISRAGGNLSLQPPRLQ